MDEEQKEHKKVEFIDDDSEAPKMINKLADKLKKFDIYAGVEYTIKLQSTDSSSGAQIRRKTPKLTMTDSTSMTITTVGEFNRSGRTFVCDRSIDTSLTNVDKVVATSSCFKSEMGTQYEHQKLSGEVIQRISSSKKMAKFLKSTVPILEEELNKTIVLARIL